MDRAACRASLTVCVLGVLVVATCVVAQQDQPVTLRYVHKAGMQATTEIAGTGSGTLTVEMQGQPKPVSASIDVSMDLGMQGKTVEVLPDGSGRIECRFTKFGTNSVTADEDPATPDSEVKVLLGPEGLSLTVNGQPVPFEAQAPMGFRVVVLSGKYQGAGEFLFDIDLGQMVGDFTVGLKMRGETVILKPPKDPNRPQEAAPKVDIAKLMTQPFVMRVGPRGQVMEIEGGALEVLQQLGGQGGFNISDMMNLSQASLPDHPVRVGEVWQTTSSTEPKDGGLRVEIQVISKLAGIEVKDGRRLARIQSHAEISMSSPELTDAQKAQEISRTRMLMNMDLNGSIKIGG